MEIDWLVATRGDRQALYRRVKLIVDRRFGGDWSRFYAAIPTHAAPRGHGDQDNFRAGRISRKRAQAIFDEITTAWPEDARAILNAIADPDMMTKATGWAVTLDQHGERGRLRVVALDDPSITVVAFAARRPVQSLRLGQSFCFALDSAFAGEALALQSVSGRWHLLPLSRNAGPVPLTHGDQFLPLDPATRTPIALSEDTHLGPHEFVVLTWSGGTPKLPPMAEPLNSEQLDALTRAIASFESAVWHRLDVLFTP